MRRKTSTPALLLLVLALSACATTGSVPQPPPPSLKLAPPSPEVMQRREPTFLQRLWPEFYESVGSKPTPSSDS